MENQTVAEPSTPKQPQTPSQTPPPTFVGNTNDLVAIVAALAAGFSGLCCLTWGYGIYCLPVIGILLGVAAVLNAQASVNPDRTRRWGWISVGVSGGVLLVIFLLILCVGLVYAGAIALAVANPAIPTPRY